MPVYRLGEFIPVIDPAAYVHPEAVVIGDVIIAADVFVGPGAVLRGDFGRIQLDQGSNLQDTCVMHAFPDKDCVVKKDGHIGHGAILHGCVIGENAMVGMNAVVMDDSVIAKDSMIAACSFVGAGFSCEERSMIMGIPAKVTRTLKDEEIQWKTHGTGEYQQLAVRCKDQLEIATPLTEAQANRPRVSVSDFQPKQ